VEPTSWRDSPRSMILRIFTRFERMSLILSCVYSLTNHVIDVVIVIVNRFPVHDSDGTRAITLCRFSGRGKGTAQNLQSQKKIARNRLRMTNRACLIARQVYVQRAQLEVSRARDDRENVADHRLVLLLVVVVCSVAEVPPSKRQDHVERARCYHASCRSSSTIPPPFVVPSLLMRSDKLCDLRNSMTFHCEWYFGNISI